MSCRKICCCFAFISNPKYIYFTCQTWAHKRFFGFFFWLHWQGWKSQGYKRGMFCFACRPKSLSLEKAITWKYQKVNSFTLHSLPLTVIHYIFKFFLRVVSMTSQFICILQTEINWTDIHAETVLTVVNFELGDKSKHWALLTLLWRNTSVTKESINGRIHIFPPQIDLSQTHKLF